MTTESVSPTSTHASAAGEILRRCDGKQSAEQIIADLRIAFQSDAIDNDVEAFLRSATSDGWVEWRDGATP